MLQAYIPSVATMIVIAMGFLFNNSRLTDLGTNLNRRIDDVVTRMDRIENRIDRTEAQYGRLESVLIGKLDEIEARLHRLEDRG